MLLTFCRDSLVESILDFSKRQSIREDKSNRWKPGRKIHFWRGNPRNKRGNPETDPYSFGTGVCLDTKFVEIYCELNFVRVGFGSLIPGFEIIRGKVLLDLFARKDGLENWQDMKTFFNNQTFRGKIILWDPKNCIFEL